MIKQASNSIYYHIVFYVKDEVLFSTGELDKIYEFVKNICDENKVKLYEVGGTDNHIHLLVVLPIRLNLYTVTNLLKDSSSNFVINNLKKSNTYIWKDGFGYFNVSPQHLSFVSTYIKKQEQHHKMEFIFPELEEINPKTLK